MSYAGSVGALALFITLSACEAPHVASHAMPAAAPEPQITTTARLVTSTAQLTRVQDPSTVCMVNNQYMRAPQIPVTVGSRTYFGCCEMCKGRLQSDPSARSAVDPVTGAVVDKASAVIGYDAQNKVYYFENEASFLRYASRSI